jgi:hypothetical protein
MSDCAAPEREPHGYNAFDDAGHHVDHHTYADRWPKDAMDTFRLFGRRWGAIQHVWL